MSPSERDAVKNFSVRTPVLSGMFSKVLKVLRDIASERSKVAWGLLRNEAPPQKTRFQGDFLPLTPGLEESISRFFHLSNSKLPANTPPSSPASRVHKPSFCTGRRGYSYKVSMSSKVTQQMRS